MTQGQSHTKMTCQASTLTYDMCQGGAFGGVVGEKEMADLHTGGTSVLSQQTALSFMRFLHTLAFQSADQIKALLTRFEPAVWTTLSGGKQMWVCPGCGHTSRNWEDSPGNSFHPEVLKVPVSPVLPRTADSGHFLNAASSREPPAGHTALPVQSYVRG